MKNLLNYKYFNNIKFIKPKDTSILYYIQSNYINNFKLINCKKANSFYNLQSIKQFSSISNASTSITNNLKNKVNQFLKKVHPDILEGKYSEEYKIENSKSIQELNMFLNSLKENISFSSKYIDFNIIDYSVIENNNENDNNLSKITLELPDIKSNSLNHSSKLILSNRLDKILIDINKKQKKAHSLGVKLSEDNLFSLNDDIHKQQRLEKRPKILKSSDILKLKETKSIADQIKKEKSEIKLSSGIKESLLNLNISNKNKQKYKDIINWGQNLTKNYKDINEVLAEFYPYELIYFDHSTSSDKDKQDEFITNLRIISNNIYNNKDNLNNQYTISNELFANQKSILINEGIRFNIISIEKNHIIDNKNESNLNYLISQGYSCSTPGFINIPYNFKFLDLVNFIKIKGIDAVKLKQSYFNEFKIINLMKEELVKLIKIDELNIEKLDINSFKNVYYKDKSLSKNTTISIYLDYCLKCKLALKKLIKYFSIINNDADINENSYIVKKVINLVYNYEFEENNIKIIYKKNKSNKIITEISIYLNFQYEDSDLLELKKIMFNKDVNNFNQDLYNTF